MISKVEFAVVITFLERGCGKKLQEGGAEIYYECLSDLPLPLLQLAARRALLEGEYPVFPQVGTLRKLALESQKADRPSAIEAWALVRKAMQNYGYYRESDGLASLPPSVREAAQCLGWRELCDATEPEIVRAQFCKAYESQQKRADRAALLPPSIRRDLEAIGQSVEAPKAIELEERGRRHE